MNQVYITFSSPIGELTLCQRGSALSHLLFESENPPEGFSPSSTPLLEQGKKELMEYFKGKRKDFDLPLDPQGSPFQQKVWKALAEIPYGTTCSYKSIAEKIGNAKACRAVGGANNKNPLPVILPCHRVLGSNGSLTGYGGGLPTKVFLLELEEKNTTGDLSIQKNPPVCY